MSRKSIARRSRVYAVVRREGEGHLRWRHERVGILAADREPRRASLRQNWAEALDVPRVHAHALKLWVMLRLGDGSIV